MAVQNVYGLRLSRAATSINIAVPAWGVFRVIGVRTATSCRFREGVKL